MTDQPKDIEEAEQEEGKAPALSSGVPDVHNHDDQGLEHRIHLDKPVSDPDKESSATGPFSGMETLLNEDQKIVPDDHMPDEVKEDMGEPVLEIEKIHPDDVKDLDEGQGFMVSENDGASADDESPIVPTNEYRDEPSDAGVLADEGASGEEEEPEYASADDESPIVPTNEYRDEPSDAGVLADEGASGEEEEPEYEEEDHDDEQPPLTQEAPPDVNPPDMENASPEEDLDFGIPESEQKIITQEDGPPMEYPSAFGTEPTAVNVPPPPSPLQEKEAGENSYVKFSSATPEKPKSRAALATAFSLLALAGAAGALLMAIQMSDHIARLDLKLSNIQGGAPARNQSGEIADINRRLDDLGRTVAAVRLAAPAKTAAKAAAPPPRTPARTPAIKPESRIHPSAADFRDFTAKPEPKIKAAAIAPKSPTASAEGAWVVNLTSLSDATIAKQELARLRKLGVPAENIQVNVHGKRWYRIRVTGFASAEKARQERKALADRLGIQGTWIGRL